MAHYKAIVSLAVFGALFMVEVQSAGKKKVSDYFTLCKRSEPDLNACVKNSIEKSKPLIVKGIADLKIPSFDPLFIPSMELVEGEGNFKFSLILRNMTITGMQDFEIVRVDLKRDKSLWEQDMLIPKVRFEAEYEMEGKIASLPIKGDGHSTFVFDNVRTDIRVVMKNITRDGHVYAFVEEVGWKINPEKAQSNFTNLFNGDRVLGETTNRFLNENWRESFEAYKHLPEEAFSTIFKGVIQNFYSQHPLDELYPE